jgi:hypothetical protein
MLVRGFDCPRPEAGAESSRAMNSGIRDNHCGGKVGDFLKPHLRDGSRMSVVPVYFTIYAALVGLVERLLTAQRAVPTADTTALAREVHQRVYRLSGLTPEDIRLVEGAVT